VSREAEREEKTQRQKSSKRGGAGKDSYLINISLSMTQADPASTASISAPRIPIFVCESRVKMSVRPSKSPEACFKAILEAPDQESAILHVYRVIRLQGRHAAAGIGIAGRSWYQHVRNVIHTKVICSIPRMIHILCRRPAFWFGCPLDCTVP